MAELISGKLVSQKVRSEIASEVESFSKEFGHAPVVPAPKLSGEAAASKCKSLYLNQTHLRH